MSHGVNGFFQDALKLNQRSFNSRFVSRFAFNVFDAIISCNVVRRDLHNIYSRDFFPRSFANRLILSKLTRREKGVLLLFSEGHGDGHAEDLIQLDL